MSLLYRITHLSGKCRSGSKVPEVRPRKLGGRLYLPHKPAKYVVHMIPIREGAMAKALCGRKPGRTSVGWSKHDDDKLTCPRCLHRANFGSLPEYQRQNKEMA